MKTHDNIKSLIHVVDAYPLLGLEFSGRIERSDRASLSIVIVVKLLAWFVEMVFITIVCKYLTRDSIALFEHPHAILAAAVIKQGLQDRKNVQNLK